MESDLNARSPRIIATDKVLIQPVPVQDMAIPPARIDAHVLPAAALRIKRNCDKEQECYEEIPSHSPGMTRLKSLEVPDWENESLLGIILVRDALVNPDREPVADFPLHEFVLPRLIGQPPADVVIIQV